MDAKELLAMRELVASLTELLATYRAANNKWAGDDEVTTRAHNALGMAMPLIVKPVDTGAGQAHNQTSQPGDNK